MSLLVLGAGYVGQALLARHPDAVGTRRSSVPLRFDLREPSTWEALPDAGRIVWTFPADEPDLAVQLRARFARDAALVVLGSTSAYVTTEPDQWIDETAPLDLSQPRVVGEERLREAGACVLQLAGIWGPGRDPARWLEQGRIRDGRKFVNLAHLDDIVASIEQALALPRPGIRVNVCDGVPRRWSEHLERLRASGRLPPGAPLPEGIPGTDSRRVRNDRLRAWLPADHQFHLFT